jgi:hypothetical protein
MRSKINCMKTYADCPAAPGCVDTSQPWRCSSSGACVSHFSFCPFNVRLRQEYPRGCGSWLGQKYEKCFDGVCRPKGYCKCVKYSGCPVGTYQCPNGLCANGLLGCTGQGRASVHRPFSCGNNVRRSEIKKCGPIFPIAGIDFPKNDKIVWNGQNYRGKKT